MEQQDHFVTFWRAIVAFPIAMAAGSMAALPCLMINSSGDFPNLDNLSFASRVLRLVKVEFGTALIGFIFFSLPVFPIYALGMYVVHKLGTRHWFSFSLLGAILSAGIWLAMGASQTNSIAHASPYPALIRFVIPVGAVGGLACWCFLRLTYSAVAAVSR
jgi:hypothetical protein